MLTNRTKLICKIRGKGMLVLLKKLQLQFSARRYLFLPRNFELYTSLLLLKKLQNSLGTCKGVLTEEMCTSIEAFLH